MRITTGLVFAIYTTSLIVFGKTVDSRTLTGIFTNRHVPGDLMPVDFEDANVEDHAPHTIMAYSPLSSYHGYPEFSERERRAALGVADHMARLRRGSVNFGDDMARLRRGSVNFGDDMARLRRAILGEHMARLRRGSINFGEQMARLRRAAIMVEDMARL